jgi:hypothetical protein
VKASLDDDIIKKHLNEHPEVPDVIANTEAAEAAHESGIESVIDSGISHAELIPEAAGEFADELVTSFGEMTDQVVPQIALLVIAARYANNVRSGMELSEAAVIAKQQAARVTAVSSAAWLASTLTGWEGARLAVVVTVATTELGLGKLDAEVSLSTDRIKSLRSVVSV